MPKLLQINTSLNCNSTGKIAEQIGLLAITKGWDCYIGHGHRYKKPSKLKTYEVGNLVEEKLHMFNSLLFDKHGLGSKKATERFITWIKELSPDIIHLHNIHGYFLNYLVLFDYLGKIDIPIVWTLHDCWSMTGHCSFFEGVGCEKWKIGCGQCPYLKDYPMSLWLDRSAVNYKRKNQAFTLPTDMTIVPVSQWLGDLVSNSFLCKYPVKVIHNGIDVNIFQPKEIDLRERYGIARKKTVVLGVASVWHERKGLNDFVKLAKEEKYQVILVGVSENIKKKIPDNIIAIPRTNSQRDLAELYSGADVFVNPTYDDNFPTTNIEALACGTPVITYRTGGSPEAIDEDTGWVVEKGDIEGLCQIIDNYFTLPEEEKNVKRIRSRERAIKLYNKDDRFQDYINLYSELLHEKGSTR
jgi:glycosyltransferase involved in cell wall biosynthesis